MNWKNLFFISTVFWVAVFFVSNCTQQGGDEMVDDASGEKITICPPPPGAKHKDKIKCDEIAARINGYKVFMAATKVSVSSSSLETGGELPPLDMPHVTPVHDTLVSWDSLQAELGLLRGFQFGIGDFRNIVKYADSIKRTSKGEFVVDSVYTMLAINPSKTGRKGYAIKYMDMYFQASKKNKRTGANSLITFSHPQTYDSVSPLDGYDNFPLPCPTSCPPGE